VWSGEAWCGRFVVTVVPPSKAAAARAQALRPLLQGALAELARQVDTHDVDSELSVFHTPPERRPRRLEPLPPRGTVAQGTALLVGRALAVAEATDGAFDPTRPASPVPGVQDVPVARPTFRRITVAAGMLRQDGYDVVVDLAGVVAGAAAQALARVLAEHGFAAARVVVDAPCAGESGALAHCTGPLAVVVEGGRARATVQRGARLVDPRTGSDVGEGLPERCTVQAVDAVVAAGLAHACLVLGEAGLTDALRRFDAQLVPSSSSPVP
jgi:thiamine biosynthesis lipoprotein ApbE